jgi:uroporphyrinogen decarboxylase
MKRKERFLAAVHHRPVDRVPMYDFLFQQPLYEALIGRKPQGYNACDAIECALALDHDAVWIPFGGYEGFTPKRLAEDIYIDEWGTTFQKNFASWPGDAPIRFPIKTRADLKGWNPPDPTLTGRDAEVRTAVQLPHDDITITGGVGGPFTTTWMLMGYEALALSIYDDPTLVVELFGIANEFNKEAARRSVQAGAEAIWIADDLGDSSRGFLKVDQFRQYYLPYLADLAETIDSLGVPVLLHCCGHWQEYIADIAQTKVAAIHPMQRTAGWDLRWAKEHWGKRFCLIGNIDSSRTLPFGSPKDVAAEVRAAIDIAAPGSGYVLASDHSLHDGISVENIVTLFRTGAEAGRLTG